MALLSVLLGFIGEVIHMIILNASSIGVLIILICEWLEAGRKKK